MEEVSIGQPDKAETYLGMILEAIVARPAEPKLTDTDEEHIRLFRTAFPGEEMCCIPMREYRKLLNLAEARDQRPTDAGNGDAAQLVEDVFQLLSYDFNGAMKEPASALVFSAIRAAKLEGVKLGLEAAEQAAKETASKLYSADTWTCGTCAEYIRALDPETVAAAMPTDGS